MIKIALVSHSPALAGAERMLFNLACILKDSEEFIPIVIIPRGGQNSELQLQCEEHNILTIGLNNSCWYVYCEANSMSHISQITMRGIYELKIVLTKIEADIVVGNTLTSLIPALAAQALQIPFVTWIHGVLDNALVSEKFDSEQRLLFDRTILALSSLIISNSLWTSRYYEPISLSPYTTCYNWTPHPVNVKPFQEDELPVFVCLNTFDLYKGMVLLIKAIKLLDETGREFVVEFYGDGAEKVKYELRKLVEKYNLEKRVIFKGRTIDIDNVYNRSFCLVQPSYIEAFGMTLIEAMAHSRPVISTMGGGPQEIVVDGQTGYLIERGDPKAFAEKMEYLLCHREQAKQMGLDGERVYRDKFSEESAAQRLLPLLRTAFKEYKGSTKYQRLIHDITIHYLQEQAGPIEIPNKSISMEAMPSVATYDPEDLCFSGALSGNRRYGITGRDKPIEKIGVLLACLAGKPEGGNLVINVYKDNKKIGSSMLRASELKMDTWTWFTFSAMKDCSGRLTIELCPKDLNGLGVFELHSKRSLIYKVFNKLGYPLKGVDVLKAAIL